MAEENEKIGNPLQISDPILRFTNNNFITTERDCFVLAIQSGSIIAAHYAYTPAHFKSFCKRANEVLSEYEEKYGPIPEILEENESS